MIPMLLEIMNARVTAGLICPPNALVNIKEEGREEDKRMLNKIKR